MAKRGRSSRRVGSTHPPHVFEPEELLTFIELRPFTRRWHALDLDDRDLQALQVMIMARPHVGAVVEGTGGLRKVRFAHPKQDSGKSGGLRVLYAYFPDVGTVVLAIVYAKGVQDDLNDKEKAALRTAVQKVERLLISRSYRVTPKAQRKDK
jgi:hypothetical protein